MSCFSVANVAAKAVAPSEMYLPTDGHFSKLGASLVAWHIVEVFSEGDFR